MSLRKPVLIFVFTAVLILLGRAPTIISPPWDIDEGLYATVGQALGRGELLYHDVWDNKPPAIYWLFDQIGKLGGDFTSFRLAATFVLILSAAIIFYLARRSLSSGKSWWVLGIFSFLAIVPVIETNISNAEIFFLPLTSLAILLVVLVEWWKWSPRWYLGVGALLALGFLFKVVVLFDALAILTLLYLKYGLNFKLYLARLMAGASVVLLPAAIYLAANNLVGDFIRAAFLNNYGYVAAGNLTTLSTLAISNPWVTITGKIIAVLAVVWVIKNHWGSKITPVTLFYLWLVFTLFGAVLSGRPYFHYLIASQGALALLIPEFWSKIWPISQLLGRSVTDYLKGGLVVAGVGLALLFGFGGKLQVIASTPELSRMAQGYYVNAFGYLTGHISQSEFYDFYGTSVGLNLQLADYLKTHSSKTARVYIWGNAPWVYYLSERRHATKYLVAYQLDFVKEAKDETLQELHTSPPELVIMTNEPAFIATSGAPTPVWLEFNDWLNQNYQLKDQVGLADIYERRALADANLILVPLIPEP